MRSPHRRSRSKRAQTCFSHSKRWHSGRDKIVCGSPDLCSRSLRFPSWHTRHGGAWRRLPARREIVPDPTLPDQVRALRPAGRQSGRPDRLHAGTVLEKYVYGPLFTPLLHARHRRRRQVGRVRRSTPRRGSLRLVRYGPFASTLSPIPDIGPLRRCKAFRSGNRIMAHHRHRSEYGRASMDGAGG